ncbi:hypothetical protein NLI96_g7412 [Meripilus lineatus]|uniref:Uncharacterized protein n=1 Tax=Meripilus lineatus TaxID=2056292 RepID=A0AAD5YC35_9APHY|nr:hypothetical protein NLI96_g7412 [Physisporinus lineatus]
MQSCELPIEVCERVIDCLALPAHNPTWYDYLEFTNSKPTLYADAFLGTLARHPHRAQLVQFLAIAPLPPPSPLSSPEPVSPSLRSSDSSTPTSSTVLPSNSPASSAPPVTSSPSHSPQTSVAISNDQQSNAEEIPPQSGSGNATSPESSQFNVLSRDQTQDKDLSRLRYLEIGYLQSSDRDKVHYILQQCMHSLRFLRLLSSDADIFGSLSLSSHSKLEYLDIREPSLRSPNGIAIFASHIFQLLSPSLVYLIIGPFTTLDLESLATSQSSWKDIDDALGQPKFNRLAYFVMRLHSSYKGNTDHETLRATFQNILPQSYQRGILWVGRYIDAIRDYRGVLQHFICAKTMSASSALLGLSGPMHTYETPSDK